MADPNAMSRAGDPLTSMEAAEAIAPLVSDLQGAILDIYRCYGPMSARQAEAIPALAHLGASTVRKRVSELARSGLLVAAGSERTSGRSRCTVYAVRGDG